VTPPSLADAVEALVAAVFLERGLDAAACSAADRGALAQDLARTWTEERAAGATAGASGIAPSYELVETGGPAHDRCFASKCAHQGVLLGEGA